MEKHCQLLILSKLYDNNVMLLLAYYSNFKLKFTIIQVTLSNNNIVEMVLGLFL